VGVDARVEEQEHDSNSERGLRKRVLKRRWAACDTDTAEGRQKKDGPRHGMTRRRVDTERKEPWGSRERGSKDVQGSEKA
jgi:hypothetical protein